VTRRGSGDRWHLWTSLIAPLIFGAAVSVMLWLAAADFDARVSSLRPQPDNATAVHNLFFKN